VELSFDAELWQHHGEGGWHFVTLPEDVATDVRELAPMRGGFGSVRVTATVGDVRWATSLFPDSKSSSFVLPVKRRVRDANDLLPGDVVHVRIGVGED
jgi:Domain of unknown function (DUF1905)